MRAYGELRLDAKCERWVIDSIEPHVALRLKQLFPRLPKASSGPFTFVRDQANAADLEWFMQRYPLVMDDDDREALEADARGFRDGVAERERILQPEYTPTGREGVREGQSLRPYQGRAVDLIGQRYSQLLGDVLGLGKTYTAAGAMLLPRAPPAVAVCQPHLQKQWLNVIERFTTLRVHCVTTTRPYTLPTADVYLFRYTQLPGWVDFFETIGPGLVVYDEIQELRRGQDSQKGRAAAVLSGVAVYRLGLSGTPLINFGIEAYNVLEFIESGLLGTRQEFLREWTHDGQMLSDPRALGTFLREQHIFLRRTRVEVERELPEPDKVVQTVGHDEQAVRSADELAEQLAIQATSGSFVERGRAGRELDTLLRHRTGVAKAPYVAEFVRLIAEAGEPVIVAGWHRDVYAIWNDRLADLAPAMYTGSETPAQKRHEADRFMNGETDILFMSLRSGAGLDGLQQRCATVVFGELDWSARVHDQLIGRLRRDGQDADRPVLAFFAVADEGSDPAMIEVIGVKAADSEPVVDPDMGFEPSAGSDPQPLQRLVERYRNCRTKRETEAA